MSAWQRGLGPNAVRMPVIGALAVAVLAAAIVLVGTRGGTYELRATFDDVRGLIPGGEVRAGAIKVGRVRHVTLGADGYPEVVMEVDAAFRIHRGGTADIRLGSNAGVVNRVVELTTGDNRAPVLPSGTTLTRAQTDQPVNFDEASNTLNAPVRADIRRFLAGLDRATSGRGSDIAGTLRNGPAALNESANLLAEANGDSAALTTLVAEGERAVSALASSPTDVGAAIDETSTLLRTTASRHSELRSSAQSLGPALVRTRLLLARLRKATPRTRVLLQELGPLMDELAPLAHLLPRVRGSAGPFVRETRTLVGHTRRDLRRIAPIIDAAFPATTTIGPLTKSALPLAQAIRAYAPEVAGLFQNLNSAIGGYNAAGHVLSITANFGPPVGDSARSIGGDDCGPGLLAAPFVRVPGVLACDPWTDYEKSFLSPPQDAP